MIDVAVRSGRFPEARLAGRLLSDDRLARLTSRGDERAFAALYERHRGALYRYCRSIVHDDDDAQDALQSALTRAFAALQDGEREIAVRPWLFRIVHNEAISLLRRHRPADPIDEQDVAQGSVESAVEQRERLALLVADMQTLGERQRAALVMRELSGLSIEEIAGALAISSGAAKQALFEARCALHELAQGRAMECEAVRRTISERDGRLLRGRRLRAHLRACSDCTSFRALIDTRSADLRALVPPLPGAASLGLLARLLDLGAGHASEAVATAGASLGGPAVASLVAKGLAGAALMTAASGVAAQLAGEHAGGRVPAAPAPHAAPQAPAPAGPEAGRPHPAVRRGEGEPAAARTGHRAQPQPSAGGGAASSAPPPAPTAFDSRPTPAPASAPAVQASTTPIAPPAQAPAGSPGDAAPPGAADVSPDAPPHGAAGAPAAPVALPHGPPVQPPGQAKKTASEAASALSAEHVPPGQAKRAAQPPKSAPAPPPAAKPAPPGQQQHDDDPGPPNGAGNGHAPGSQAGPPPGRGHR